MSRRETGAAGRVHEAMKASFKDISAHVDDARIEERAGYLLLVFPTLPLPALNGVWADDPGEEPEAVRELAGAIAEVEGLGLPCSVQTRAGLTPGLEAEARRLGFGLEEAVPAMTATPEDLLPTDETELEIDRVADTEGLEQARMLAEAGFEVPAELFAPLYTPEIAATPGLSVYVARDGGMPVSTVTSFTRGDAVGIFNVATPAEYRRRGYGTAVTTRAVGDGFDSGAAFAWLQSSMLGESVYRQIGFRHVETYTLLTRPQDAAHPSTDRMRTADSPLRPSS